jgi:hypothetical protein
MRPLKFSLLITRGMIVIIHLACLSNPLFDLLKLNGSTNQTKGEPVPNKGCAIVQTACNTVQAVRDALSGKKKCMPARKRALICGLFL